MNINVDGGVRNRYKQVPTEAEEKRPTSSQKPRTAEEVWEERREKLSVVLYYIKDKVEAFIWVAAAAYCIYYTNFFKVIFEYPDANQFFLNIALICFGINVCLAIYVSIILPYVLKISESFETYAPKVSYLGAFCGFVGFITMLVGIWPIWGWWSPVILFVMFMGYMMSAQFLPDNSLGSIIFALIFVGACFSYKWIEHEGLAHAPYVKE